MITNFVIIGFNSWQDCYSVFL